MVMKHSVESEAVPNDDSTASPGVSVLMPCYNVADTLDEAISSLVEGTYQDFEVVAVDDGSSDGTPERLEHWAHNDTRIRVLALEHGGIIPALNAGLAACRASLVARMDADDRCHPERLERQVELIGAHPELALVGCLVEGFPEGQVRGGFQAYLDWLNRLVDHESIAREIFIESPLAHPSVMFRTRWAAQVGGYQERGWPEDYDLWLRLYLAGARFAKVPEVLLYWREHPDRLTRADSRYAVSQFLRAKAHYLMLGPLKERDAVVIWGAGQMGRRIAKHLERAGAPLAAFIDIDPGKIGRQKRGKPVLPPEALPGELARPANPVVLAAVGSRGARALIRERLSGMGLREGLDWWAVA
jgi:glycosyltransferase involved in cell wall biosynthesis